VVAGAVEGGCEVGSWVLVLLRVSVGCPVAVLKLLGCGVVLLAALVEEIGVVGSGVVASGVVVAGTVVVSVGGGVVVSTSVVDGAGVAVGGSVKIVPSGQMLIFPTMKQ
jgi:hypothetical protein